MAQVTYLAAPVSLTTSTLALDSNSIGEGEDFVGTATITDQYGNPRTSETVDLEFNGSFYSMTHQGSGVYASAAITASTANTYTVKCRVGGGGGSYLTDEETLTVSAAYTYTQTVTTTPIFIVLNSYSNIPNSLWDRSTLPTIYGKFLNTGSGFTINFWDTAAKRKTGNSSNDIFYVIANSGTVSLYDSSNNLVNTGQLVYNATKGSDFSIYNVNINAT